MSDADLATDARLRSRKLPVLYLLGAVLQGLAPVLVQPIAIRILDPRQWGTVAVSINIVNVGLVVLSASLPLALTRAYFDPEQGPGAARAINGASAIASIVIAVVLGAVLLPFSSLAYAVAMVSIGFLSTMLSAQAYLRAELKAGQFILLIAGASVGAQALGLLAISTLGATADNYMLAYCVATALTAAVGVALTKPGNPLRYRAALRRALRVSLPILPHSLAVIVLNQGDGLLLKFLTGEATAGRYLAVNAFALGPIAVLQGLNNVWTPRIMASWGTPTQHTTLRAVTREALLVSVLLSVAGICGSNIGMLVLAGERPELIELARVLPLISVGYGLYLVSMSVLFAAGRTKVFAYLTVTLAVIAGVIAFFPAQQASLLWLAAVKVGAFFVLGLVYAAVANRLVGAELPLGRFIAAFVVLAALGALSLRLPTNVLTGAIMLGVLVVAAAAGALWWFWKRRGAKVASAPSQ